MEKLKIKNKKVIGEDDWNKFVKKVYNKPYSFQQQDGCRERGFYNLTVPSKYTNEEEMNDNIPLKINGDIMGVKFEKWLNTDPKDFGFGENYKTKVLWERNFYPDINSVINDLYSRGFLEEGEYIMLIDW